ncbi:hypothetical protein TOPH_02141 [Tolypocladium ophioglossoides CBS 100239]|uniref:Uncharacterized protein n=1 Tax=Tolypocladium ophioglossoides (strain CBS 100239) TaxID=1163406 RepID=A0A0L0NH05_TOLOC|nr:hypothetical protein TOPH_02141 [Tolypocladium ophioglossoides CBS 100239]
MTEFGVNPGGVSGASSIVKPRRWKDYLSALILYKTHTDILYMRDEVVCGVQPPESYASPFAAQNINARLHCETSPLPQGPDDAANRLHLAQPSVEKTPRLGEARRLVVGHEQLSPGDLGAHTHCGFVPGLAIKQLMTPRGQGLALGYEMMTDETEGAVWEDAGADVKKAGVAGAEAEGALGEAVLGYMAVRSSENGVFHGAEGALS